MLNDMFRVLAGADALDDSGSIRKKIASFRMT